MKFHKSFGETLIDIVVTLSGLVLILLAGYVRNSLLVSTLLALGTSLVAAGIITYLMRTLHAGDAARDDQITIASPDRRSLENEYRRRTYSAHKVDILSIALGGALEEMAEDRREKMLRRTLSDGAQVRLMFLSPAAEYVRQRAAENGTSPVEFQETLKQSIVYCVSIFERLKRLFEADHARSFEREQVGSLEIRLTDLCPYFTIFRTDADIIWGVYTSTKKGYFSPAFHVSQRQTPLYDELMGHFNRLWDKSLDNKTNEANYLVRFDGSSPPLINEKLLTSILGRGWRDKRKIVS
jgi:hypothetical protein